MRTEDIKSTGLASVKSEETLNVSLLSQSSSGSNERKRSLVPDEEDSNDDADESASEHVSRKEKSLGKLCKRFLVAMDEEARTGNDVHLETVARKMSVEKRRIYDIVNVMEALEAMSKTNKSFYRWHGLVRLPLLMAELAKDSLEEQLPAKIEMIAKAMCKFTELPSAGPRDTVGTLVDGTRPAPPKSLQHSDSFKSSASRDRNGKNSLAQLCRRFLMVLLCHPKDSRKVSLDVASTVLIKDPETEGCEPPSRSRCRRLYDIANVLVAMGLIRKVHYLFGTKKIPLFEYCGPEPDADPENAAANMKEFLARNGLMDVMQPPPAKLRRVLSEVVVPKVEARSHPTPAAPACTPGASCNSANVSVLTGASGSTLQRSVTLGELPRMPASAHASNNNPFHQLHALADVACQKWEELKESSMDEDKENRRPDENSVPFAKPVPRHMARLQGMGASNSLNYPLSSLGWSLDSLAMQNSLKSTFSSGYSVNSLLGQRKTPQKVTPLPPTGKITNSPKAFRPVQPLGSNTSRSISDIAMILTSIYHGQGRV